MVLTGAGRGFCSGQDLTDAGAAADLERTLREEYEPMLAAITTCPVPVIAAVKSRTDVPFLNAVRAASRAEVFYITPENRDELYEKLLPRIRAL